MERQSTRKLFKLAIALVSLLLLCMSAFMLSSCEEEKHEHTWTETVTVEAKCGVDGVKTFTCSECGETYSEAIPATAAAHNFVNHYCSICGESEYFDSSEIVIPEDHVHSFTEVAATIVATCTTPGFTVEQCSCGVTRIKSGSYVEAEGHEWGETPTSLTEPTCIKDGIAIYTCAACGETKQVVTPATGEHNYVLNETESTAATCTATGNEVYICATCGGAYTKVTEALGHDLVEVVDNEATCTEGGSKHMECTRCDYTEAPVTVPANGHTPGEPVVTPATCTVDGNSVVLCEVCSETLSNEVIKAEGHNKVLASEAGEGVDTTGHIIAATCVANRQEQEYCTVCGEWFEEWVSIENTLNPDAHAWGEEATVVRPNRTDEGYSFYTCELCGAEGTHFDIKDALGEGHTNWKNEVVETVPVTCTEDGYTLVRYYCADPSCLAISKDADGNWLEEGIWCIEKENVVPATGHTWATEIDDVTVTPDADWDGWITVKAASCTEEGLMKRYCTVCELTETKAIEKLAHTYTDSSEVPATCTEDGSITYTCEVCGDTYTDPIPALGHDYVAQNDYTKTGETHTLVVTYTCSRCGDSYSETFTEQEHVFKETTNASCDDPGVVMYVCECGYVKYDWNTYVEPLKHDYSIIVSIEGDCLTATMITYSCSRCNDTYVAVLSAPTGHAWTKVDAVEETCTTAGSNAYWYCSACGAVVVSETEPKAFETEYLKNADGEAYNYLTEKEAVEADAAIVIPAAGHNFVPYNLIGSTCTEYGATILVCDVCGVERDPDSNEITGIKLVKDTEGYTAEGEAYVKTDFTGATTEQVNAIFAAINAAIGNAADQFASAAALQNYVSGYNFTAVKYVAQLGHDFQGTLPFCMSDADLVAEYEAKVQAGESVLFADGTTAELIAQYGINDKCARCDAYKATQPHQYLYYMFAADENGDATSQYVAADGTAVDSISEAKGFTLDEVVAMEDGKYLTAAGTPNCWFEELCVNYEVCGSALAKAQHSIPDPEDPNDLFYLANCQHGDLCTVCGKELSVRAEHNLSELSAIAAISAQTQAWVDKLVATYEWAVDGSKAATCYEEGVDYEIKVCVGCLEAWAETNYSDAFVWTKDVNYTVTITTIDMLPHTWNITKTYSYYPDALGNPVEIEDTANLSCLEGWYKVDYCSVCEEQGITQARVDESGTEGTATDADGHYDIKVPANHTMAAIANYWESATYKAPTTTNAAFISYKCVFCGETIQGYYGQNTEAETGRELYTYATDEQIANSVYADQITAVRAQDKVPVTAAGNATDLIAALGDATTEYAAVQLSAPVTLTQALTFKAVATSVDLNGQALTVDASVTTSWYVTGNNSVEIKNGTINFNNELKDDIDYRTVAAFNAAGASSVVLEGVTINSKSTVLFVGDQLAASSSTVVLKDSFIYATGVYGIGTNANKGSEQDVAITIENTTIDVRNQSAEAAMTDWDNVAVFFNVPGTLTVKDSKLFADRQGLVVRGGTATVENTEITVSGKYTDGASQHLSGNWGSGSEVPMAAIVAGNRSDTSYQYATSLTLKNVTVKTENGATTFYVYGNATEAIGTTVNMDAATAASLGTLADPANGAIYGDTDVFVKVFVDGVLQVRPDPAP